MIRMIRLTVNKKEERAANFKRFCSGNPIRCHAVKTDVVMIIVSIFIHDHKPHHLLWSWSSPSSTSSSPWSPSSICSSKVADCQDGAVALRINPCPRICNMVDFHNDINADRDDHDDDCDEGAVSLRLNICKPWRARVQCAKYVSTQSLTDDQ